MPVLSVLILGLVLMLAGCAVPAGPPGAASVGPAPARVLAPAQVSEYMAEQRRALRSALASQIARNEISLVSLPEDTLLLAVSTDMAFEIARDELTAAGRAALQALAEVLRQHPASIVHIIGHTDRAGDAVFNQRLSYKRALEVMDYLADYRIDRGRLWASGRGEREPIASNATTLGRRSNRRVVVVIRPVVAGRESRAYRLPPVLRS